MYPFTTMKMYSYKFSRVGNPFLLFTSEAEIFGNTRGGKSALQCLGHVGLLCFLVLDSDWLAVVCLILLKPNHFWCCGDKLDCMLNWINCPSFSKEGFEIVYCYQQNCILLFVEHKGLLLPTCFGGVNCALSIWIMIVFGFVAIWHMVIGWYEEILIGPNS